MTKFRLKLITFTLNAPKNLSLVKLFVSNKASCEWVAGWKIGKPLGAPGKKCKKKGSLTQFDEKKSKNQCFFAVFCCFLWFFNNFFIFYFIFFNFYNSSKQGLLNRIVGIYTTTSPPPQILFYNFIFYF